MRALSRLFPPADLLSRLDVQPTLKTNSRLGTVGWTAAALSAGQLLIVVFTSEWWRGLSSVQLSSWQRWALIGSVAGFVVAFALINWLRLWVRESRRPFRYTFFVGKFESVEGTQPAPRLAWLPEDLAERLSGRIRRLSLLDPRYSKGAEVGEAHIHIGGTYGVRDERIEVFPWVRLGSDREPATLAHPVRFSIKQEGLDAGHGAAFEKLVEWIYFSIASHVYARIREDVQGKIALLPKRYFRAAAYFYEAEDYLRSHTLDAYRDAQSLYAEALKLYDADWREPADSRTRRLLAWITRWRHVWSLRWRRSLSALWPRLGRVELMVARAEIGYARALLDRRALAGLSGQQLNPVFEARPVAQRAVERLSNLRSSVPARDEALFDARVTLAGALVAVGSPAMAEDELDTAQRENPKRAERDARYLYARGRVVTQQAQQFFRRAVEIDPQLEVAQFHVALAADTFWRRRGSLDKGVVGMVIDEYDRVLRLNPAHVAAWSSQGFLYWLLGERGKARRVLERGREFKEMRRETFVAQLDHTLTRIAAEEGRFAEAYQSYMSAVTAHFAEGISHAPDGYTAADFEGMTEAMLERFEDYRDRVIGRWEAIRAQNGRRGRRVADSVLAFVLNDYAEACMNYVLRSGDPRYVERAREMLLKALDLNPRYPMISFNLQRLDRWQTQAFDPPEPATLSDVNELAQYDELFARLPSETDHLERVLRYEPRWPDGMMALASAYSRKASQERILAPRLWAAAAACRKEAKELRPAWGASTAEDRFDSEVTTERRSEARRLVHDPVDRQQRGAGLARAAGESSAPALPPRAKAEHDRSRILLEAARRMRDRTWELLESAEHHEQKAEMHVRRLLPHAWLWSSDGELDLSLLDRSDLGRRREWERKLDDLHARALLLWSWLRFERALREEQEAAEQKAAATESDGARAGRLALSRLRLRKAEQERRVRPHEVFRALELCRRHFWPNDLDLLRLFSESEWDGEESREFCAETLQRVTRHTFERDPVFWSLWHLADDAPDVAEVLRSAAEQRGIPPYMYVWLGWRLDGLERPDFALIAYGNALRSQQSDMLLDLADRLAEGGHWSVRRRALGRAMAADRVRHGPDAPLDDLYPREIGRSLWQVGRHDRAVAWFARVSGENETGAWRTALVSEVVSNGPRSKETYRLLKRWLGHDLTRAQGNGRPRTAMRRDAAAALLLLTHSWYQEVVHREWDPDRSTLEGPAATPPIVIEADPGFFPSGPKSRAAKQLLEKELPAMRTDIADETGVEIPPISIHPTPGLGEGRYRLYLNEVPLVDQVLAPEQRYFVKEAEAGGLTGLPDQDPLTAAAGLWLRRRPDGIAAYNRSTYIARRLRSLVLAHLDELLSTEEAMRLLDRWSEDDGGSEERRAIRAIHLDDERRRTRFVRLLRAVAAERIPLTDLDPIVRTFVEAPDDADTVEVAERARGALRVAERMIDPSKVADALPPQVEDRLEDWIYEDAGRRVLAPPTEIADELRSQVKDALLPGGTSALIVLRAGLRPFVRRIVAQVDPRLDVLARSELRDVVLLAHESTSQSVDEVATP